MTVVCTTMAIHLQTPPDRQAPLVLCPGDPDRVALVARDLLTDAELVTSTRGLLGFTGLYRGVPVTVQATGMGGGSTAIVVHELIELGARVLIRAGTTGGLQTDVRAGDLIVATTALAADGTAVALAGEVSVPADPHVVTALRESTTGSDRRVHVGPIVTTDLFYDIDPTRNGRWQTEGLLAVEMEAAVIQSLAARTGTRAGCVLAVSNTLVGDDAGWLPGRERERATLDACRAGLDALVSLG